MPRTSTFVPYVLDLLGPLGPVEARAMFGGHVLKLAGLTFGLVMDERLYFKTDAEGVEAFRAAGCEPFTYAKGEGQSVAMSYWSAPDEALESPEGLAPWAERGLAAAQRAAAKKAPRLKPARKSSARKSSTRRPSARKSSAK